MRPTRKPLPQKAYRVIISHSFYAGNPSTIEIQTAEVERETRYFYFLKQPFRTDYVKRIDRGTACLDLKAKLEEMYVERVKARVKLEEEMNLIENELSKLREGAF